MWDWGGLTSTSKGEYFKLGVLCVIAIVITLVLVSAGLRQVVRYANTVKETELSQETALVTVTEENS